jgi:hypothetical protein
VTGFSNSIPTTAHAANKAVQAAKILFVNPLANIPSSIIPEGK